MAKKEFRCVIKGCQKDEAAHAREYDHIEETIGRQAAEEYESRHRNALEDDEDR